MPLPARRRLRLLAPFPTLSLFAGVLLTLAAICPPSALAQQVELQIRAAGPEDDYLTWAPAPARIRQVPQPGNLDKAVVLTNDPEQPVPTGRQLPLDGNVAFAKSVAPGATATEQTLALVLPKDGAWVSFFVAGSFPRASTEDKDAVIEVHEGSASGPLIYRHGAMVRIRKDQRDLTDRERSRFLNAVSRLHRERKGYERFVRIHELASMGKYQDPAVYFWPDLAHRGPAFLAWHRAYLLSFERELQTVDPSVALPYWKMELLASVFDENFMGSNPVTTDAFVEPQFAATNPLAHWQINGEPLYRFPYQRTDEQDLKGRFFSDATLFIEQTYLKFSRKQEANPHNLGHNWTGPWMQNCMISPSDPVFWPFHAGFDRQWAKWQWTGSRLQPDGSGESFSPNDTYDDTATGCNVASPSSCVPIGHHLKDTMWPWNSKVGPGASIKGNRPPANLSQGYMGPFPQATTVGLWPAAPAIPTPGDVIDYAGVTPQRLDMGFAYDDVPFGARPQQVIAMATPAPGSVPAQIETARPAATRVVENRSTQIDPEVFAALATATDRSQPEAQRIDALQMLSPLPGATVIPAAIAILDEAGRSAALGAAAIETLSLQMMFGEFDHPTHHVAMEALHKALTDKDLAVRQSALRVLASHRDPMLIQKLAASLDNSADKSFAAVDAIRGLAVAGAALQHAPSIRKHIDVGENEVRAAAIVALASDAASRPAVAAILADRNQPEIVRSAAIRNLAAGNSDASGFLINVLKNSSESQVLREQAAGALATTIETHGSGLNKVELNGIATELRKIDSAIAPAVDRALKATDALSEKK